MPCLANLLVLTSPPQAAFQHSPGLRAVSHARFFQIIPYIQHCLVPFCGSKIEEINLDVHTNEPVATWFDRSKICRPIFDPFTVTVPDKWIVVYRN